MYSAGDAPAHDNPQLYEQQWSDQQGYSQPRLQEPSPGQNSPSQPPYSAPPFAIYSLEQGIDGKILAACSYLGLWLSGLLLVLFVRENRFIRFHAMQSLLFYGGITIIYISLASIAHHILFLHVFAILAFLLVSMVGFIGWFVGLLGALSGNYIKLPFVGDTAERYAHRGHPTVK